MDHNLIKIIEQLFFLNVFEHNVFFFLNKFSTNAVKFCIMRCSMLDLNFNVPFL